MSKISPAELVECIKLTIDTPDVSWVLFSHGTFIIMEPDVFLSQLEDEALQIIDEYGPVTAGSAAADFSVSALAHVKGWAVSSHKQGLFTYVHPSEIDHENPTDLEIGLRGRTKRNLDSEQMEIIHVHAAEKSTTGN